ncbi:hypothetical protein P154DRAFT_608681 [Amniculicola lignicola CBS 123094]|uniref:Methyltransferase domain-containing protein n=1 Tax=Amniculicola lignicola CBS 123094 TaxID=1392246 RepID=A0A6A5WV50_9PLEO|nr:hypothetical protein P154DRAFT_608681 [Amniculicola lignicola CBS 123094]
MSTQQPLHDRPAFHSAYLTLPGSQKGFDGAPEWETLRTMVVRPECQEVLDLGYGLGWFSRYTIETGAEVVDASDNLAKMIEKAQAMTLEEAKLTINYEAQNLNTISLDEDTYDVVFSSLTFHYLSNNALDRLFEVYPTLKPRG